MLDLQRRQGLPRKRGSVKSTRERLPQSVPFPRGNELEGVGPGPRSVLLTASVESVSSGHYANIHCNTVRMLHLREWRYKQMQ